MVNGHKGAFFEDGKVVFGCADFSIKSLKALLDVKEMFDNDTGNRTIDSFELCSGVYLSVSDIKNILLLYKQYEKQLKNKNKKY